MSLYKARPTGRSRTVYGDGKDHNNVQRRSFSMQQKSVTDGESGDHDEDELA